MTWHSADAGAARGSASYHPRTVADDRAMSVGRIRNRPADPGSQRPKAPDPRGGAVGEYTAIVAHSSRSSARAISLADEKKRGPVYVRTRAMIMRRATVLECRAHAQRSFSRCKRAGPGCWSGDGSAAAAWRAAPPSGARPTPRVIHPSGATGTRAARVHGHRTNHGRRRRNKGDRLPLIVVRKRPTSTFFHHRTPPWLAEHLL